MVDTLVADQVLAQILMYPETHDQTSFVDEDDECGTTRCIAGWAVHFSEKFEVHKKDCSCGCGMGRAPYYAGTDKEISWEYAGQLALGITAEQARDIFFTMNPTFAIMKLKDLLNEQ